MQILIKERDAKKQNLLFLWCQLTLGDKEDLLQIAERMVRGNVRDYRFSVDVLNTESKLKQDTKPIR